MGLSLVAVFAIIATLGLLSLNSVQADGHQVDAGEAITTVFEFTAPEDLAGADGSGGDDIILNLKGFDVPNTAEVKLYVNGTEMTSGFNAMGSGAAEDDRITVNLNQVGNPSVNVEIDSGATVKIMILNTDTDANDVDAPALEGMYPVSVSVDIGGEGTPDHEGLASMMLHVQASVMPIASGETTDTMEEDVDSNLSISFALPAGVGLSVRDSDTITLFLEGYRAESGLDASEITIADDNNQSADAGSATAATMTPTDLKAGQMIVLGVPDMSSARGTQAITSTPGMVRQVTVTFGTDSGLMTPANGGAYTAKVWTSQASKHIVYPDKTMIDSTTPDITRVTLASNVAGEATSMNIRFITDAALVSGNTITLTMPDFALPDVSPPNAYSVNGRNVDVGHPDPDEGTVEIPMPDTTIMAGRPAVVTIKTSAGIMNPAAAGTEYTVMVKTTPESKNGESMMFEIVAAPPPVITPPGGVEVTVEPNTAGSATRLTVQFTTGDDGALLEDAEIFIMAPNFGIPTSIDADDVTVNGASPKSVAVSASDDRIILTLAAGIPANRRVSVVFKVGAGITNPAKAGTVDVSVSTTSEGQASPMKVAIMELPEAAMIQAIDVVPQVPGEDSRITFKFMTPTRLSSIENSEVIFRFHEDFSVTGGRIDVSKTTIQANSIFGGPEVDTPKASGVVNPTSATVTYETVDRQPQIRLAVPDMADDEGDQHILQGAVVTVVFQQGSGIINPTEASSYGVQWAVNDDNTLDDLGDVVLPVVVGLSGDGGKRGTSVTAVAKGVEGGEAVLFWLDTATAMAGSKTYNAPDGMYDPDTESVLCRATAESNDTATCVFEVANPPFSPGVDLWVNVQDSEGRRVGTLKAAASVGYDWKGVSLSMHPIDEAFVQLDARVTIKPSEVNIGDTVTVSMFDYLPGGGLEVKIGSVTLDLNAPGVEFRQRAIQGTGEQSFTFSIPATVGGTPIPLGKVRVDVNKTGLKGHDFKADTNITIAGATVTLSQSSILGNQSLSISGSGFSGRGAGSNRCIEQGKVLINNVQVEIIELEDSGQCRDKIELTSSGTFTLTVLLREEDGTIPDPLQTGGTHTVVITDNKGVEGRTTIEIPDRTLDVNPKTARPRTAVTVSGRNFVADNPDGSSVAVDLKYDCGGNVRRTVSAEPDASGNFEETLRVPDDCGIPSTNTITATVVIDGEETTTETTTHDIPEADVQVTPNQGAIGSEIRITGEGFRTFEGVSGIELGTKNVLGARVFYTDRDGKLDIGPFLVPGIDPGTYALVVGVGEDEERTTASVNYTVIDEGLPQKAPVAIVEGLEPLGEKLVRVFRFNNATKTWEFYDPRPEFAEANTISQMFGGNVYWLNITEDVEAVLGGKTRRLTCIEGDCWNQIVW